MTSQIKPTDQIIPGWYDTPGACATLGGISRVAVSKIAKAEGWQSKPIANGAALLHRAEDVHEYRDHKFRTKLVKSLGWKGRGLYRVADIDIPCPICGGFAVEWPAPPYEKYMCLNGHEGNV